MLNRRLMLRRKSETGAVSLWDLLILMNFSACGGGALAAVGVRDHPSARRVFIAVVMGMTIAAASACLHWRTGGYIAKKLEYDNAKLRWLYLAACIWVLAAGVLAFHGARLALRIVTQVDQAGWR